MRVGFETVGLTLDWSDANAFASGDDEKIREIAERFAKKLDLHMRFQPGTLVQHKKDIPNVLQGGPGEVMTVGSGVALVEVRHKTQVLGHTVLPGESYWFELESLEVVDDGSG